MLSLNRWRRIVFSFVLVDDAMVDAHSRDIASRKNLFLFKRITDRRFILLMRYGWRLEPPHSLEREYRLQNCLLICF
jgi:hypothetical protein